MQQNKEFVQWYNLIQVVIFTRLFFFYLCLNSTIYLFSHLIILMYYWSSFRFFQFLFPKIFLFLDFSLFHRNLENNESLLCFFFLWFISFTLYASLWKMSTFSSITHLIHLTVHILALSDSCASVDCISWTKVSIYCNIIVAEHVYNDIDNQDSTLSEDVCGS